MEQQITQEQVKSMLDRCFDDEQKALVSILWITGARPAELIELTPVCFLPLDGAVQISIPTKKHGYARTLTIANDTPFFINVLSYVNKCNTMDTRDKPIFHWRTDGCIRFLIYRLSDGKLTPYNFRHSRLTQLAKIGASPYELMVFKGARDTRSVAAYIGRSPHMIERLKDKIV